MSESSLSLTLADEAATATLGTALADALLCQREAIASSGAMIGLTGDLGSGKTTLARALLRRVGVTGPVKSPTFALLEPYEVSRLHFYHFDFYRFQNPREFLEAGFSEYFRPGSICLVEWPERAGKDLPPADLTIRLRALPAGRCATIGANTEIGERCLNHLRTFRSPARGDA